VNTDASEMTRLEQQLAGLLHYGTWLAFAVTAVGLTLALIDGRAGAPAPLAARLAMRIVTGGIACFILLPVLRVVLMLIVFIRERDRRFGVIAAVVLAIILTGFVLGTYLSNAPTSA
jgi:uncharacterized membrane protein